MAGGTLAASANDVGLTWAPPTPPGRALTYLQPTLTTNHTMTLGSGGTAGATSARANGAAPYVHVWPIMFTYFHTSPVTLMSPLASRSRRCHQPGSPGMAPMRPT